MKKKTLSFLKILLSSSAVALLLVCSSPRLPARDFYWENPVKLTDVNSQFPKTASDGKSTYIFWQEVDTSSEKIWPYFFRRCIDFLPEYIRRFSVGCRFRKLRIHIG